MKRTVNVAEAKAQLSELIDRAADGEEIVLAKHGRPRARLVALAAPRPRRVPGRGKGRVKRLPGWDDPLPQAVIEAFEGTTATKARK